MSVSTPTPLDRVRWLPFTNTESSAAAPACACLAIGGVTLDEGQAVLECGQFTSAGPFAFNGLQQVAAGTQGQCTQDFPLLATYDSSATPALGDTWIPKSGQWSLTKGSAGAANGFIVLGVIDSTAQTMLVSPAGASSTTAVVQVIDTPGVTLATPSDPYGQAVWAGAIVTPQTTAPTFANDTGGNRFSPNPTPTLSTSGQPTCWILDLDGIGGSGTPSPTLINGEMYIGILVGSYTVGSSPGVTLPLYAVRKGSQSDVVRINSNTAPPGISGSPATGQPVLPSVTSGPFFDVTVDTQTFGNSVGQFSAGVSAWLYFLDGSFQNIGGSYGTTPSPPVILCGDRYEAQLVGSYDPYPGNVGGTSSPRPLYFCRAGAGASQGATLIISNATYGQPSSLGYYDCYTADGRKVWFACSDMPGQDYSIAAGVAPSGSETCYVAPPIFFLLYEQLFAFPAGSYDPYPGGVGGTSDPRPLFTASAKGNGLTRRGAKTIAGWVGSSYGVQPYLPCELISGSNVKFRVYCLTDIVSAFSPRLPSIGSSGVELFYEQDSTLVNTSGVSFRGLTAIATSDVLDDPIGTVRMGAALSSAPGWANMDGTANSTANGGSGINMVSGNTGYYGGGFIPRGGSAAPSNTPTGSDDFDTSKIADHQDHTHTITFGGPTSIITASSGGTANVITSITNPTSGGTPVIGGVGASQLKHYGASGGGAQTAPGANLPATKPLQFLERINNSQTTTT